MKNHWEELTTKEKLSNWLDVAGKAYRQREAAFGGRYLHPWKEGAFIDDLTDFALRIEQEAYERGRRGAVEECIQELLSDDTHIDVSSKYDLGWGDGHNAAIDQLKKLTQSK